jgi:hypothetical protein
MNVYCIHTRLIELPQLSMYMYVASNISSKYILAVSEKMQFTLKPREREKQREREREREMNYFGKPSVVCH